MCISTKGGRARVASDTDAKVLVFANLYNWSTSRCRIEARTCACSDQAKEVINCQIPADWIQGMRADTFELDTSETRIRPRPSSSVTHYICIIHLSLTLDFTCRFEWCGPTQMMDEYRMALKRGLPFPLLTVVEYFAVSSEGFAWGRAYREAGYFTSIFLW